MWRALEWTGRVFLVLSALIGLFVVYQLFGTGLIEAREQRRLRAEFEERLEQMEAGEAGVGASTTTTLPRPGPGEPVALLEIPRLGVERVVVEGVEVADLHEGPGHYPHSRLPGEPGNVAIAGHRTTYGAPFHRIDELEPGDRILLTTLWGEFEYRVSDRRVVRPRENLVLWRGGDDRLTLTTCEPKYSSRQRLVVVAAPQDAGAAPAPVAPATASELPDRIDGSTRSGWRAVGLEMVGWGLATAMVGGAWWWGFRRRPRWYTWVGGLPPTLAVLFLFYVELERLLPANF